MNKQEWEEFKEMNADIFEEPIIIEMIDQFMIPDRININKFAPNYMILKNGSREIYSASAKLLNEPDLSRDGTLTIDWMANIFNRPLGYSFWFMAGYPDVVKWFSNLEEEKMKFLLDDFVEDYMDNNDKLRLPILRKIVDSYKIINKLECC